MTTRRHQAYQPFARGYFDAAHSIGGQSARGEQQHFTPAVGQVQAADIHRHAGTDRLDHEIDLVDRLLRQCNSLHDTG